MQRFGSRNSDAWFAFAACAFVPGSSFLPAGKGSAEHGTFQAVRQPGRIDFSRDIRPILSDKCFACHGPDAPNNKSQLRFDTEAHALRRSGRWPARHRPRPSGTERTRAAHHRRK